MSSKLDLPMLTNITSIVILTWLTRCADSFKTWSTLNSDKKIKLKMQILVAGLKLEHAEAAAWWNENWESLKKLAIWDEFVVKVKDCFIPSNWHLDALAAFFSVKHAPGADFQSFISDLQTVCNALTSAGTGYIITNSTIKNHPPLILCPSYFILSCPWYYFIFVVLWYHEAQYPNQSDVYNLVTPTAQFTSLEAP
ncbi:hypothetical protein ARMSODRAFT_974265 [Armillaria solidipes]|uniref:Retrotransposon gag domain-containing protein n=1 Tax=Armillaria solidipes TaxID=1076256 RepID=A0A2H3BTG7_9AGAR|nr:hypothetical protein ARMSODRAFT_974265 [Armillaria solidipes]